MKTCPKCGNEFPDTQFFCSSCGANLIDAPTPPPEPHPEKKSGIWIATSIISIFAVIILAVLLSQKSNDVDYYRRQANRYEEKYEAIEGEYNFYSKNARIILVEENKEYAELYHKYGCSDCDTNRSLWIFNSEAAKQKADPCPKCCKND